MKMHSVTMTGAIGINAGLGRSELTVDLDDLVPASAKIVAFKGDNGIGKSTFFNLGMTPHLKPPMLEGTLYDEFMPGKGLIIQRWSHAGQHYKSKIQINQSGDTRTTRAYLHTINEEGTLEPYRRADGLASDGKGKTYTACIEDILGPQSIYYLSAYRAQGAPKLAEYSKPKELMRDLLGLDEPHDLAKKAGNVKNKLGEEVSRLNEVVKNADSNKQHLYHLSLDIDKNRKAIEINLEKRTLAEERRTMAQAEVDNSASTNFEQAKLQHAITDMERRIKEETKRGNADIDFAIKQAGRLEAQRVETKSRFSADLWRITSDMQKIQVDIDKTVLLLGQKDEIQRAVREIKVIEINLSTAQGEKEILDTELATYNKGKMAVLKTKSQLEATVERGKVLRKEADSLADRAGYVDAVPCLGEGEYAGCPALADAKAAAKLLPNVVDARQELVDQYKLDLPKLHQLEGALGDFDELVKKIEAVELSIRDMNRWLTDLRPLAAKAVMLNDAQQKAKDLDAGMLVLIEDKKDALKQNEDAEIKLKEEILCAKKTVEEVKDNAKVRIVKLTADLESLPKPENDRSAELSGLLERFRSEASEAAKFHEGSIALNEQMKAERVAIEKELVRCRDKIERHEKLVDEYANWGLLEKSLYGAIDLSIEAAGPAIAAAANALLLATYGPRFTVKIVTQRQNLSNPTIREVFSINVIDGQTGREDDVLRKSGGESVWIGKALTDGVGIHFQQSSGVQYETQFGDEVEDGLTQERKALFYQMDRAAVDAGGYSRKYFISHDPAGWAMADCVIDFEDFKA